MATDLAFTNNTIPTFQYEPFSYRISNVPVGTTRLTIPVYTVPFEYLTISGSNSVSFDATNNTMPAGTQTFTIVASDASLNVLGTSSNIVTIGAARFRDALSNSISGSNYVFYKNEPITPIRIRAPIAVSLPTASPILPPGLVFSQIDVSTYDITGTPTVTVPQSNHLFIGKGLTSNLGKIITSSNVGIIVNSERMLLNLSGSPIVSNMTIGSAIDTRVITARFPPYTSPPPLTYSWSPLPDGIVVKDISGNVKSGLSFDAMDASHTLILEGTPTLAAAQAFQSAMIESNVVNIVATRKEAPLLSSNVPFTFKFGPTVLFTANVIRPILYKNLRVDPLSNYFAAQTYFITSSTGNGISNIFATTTLPTDLSLSFTPALARSDLSGIPTVSGTGNYTIRAINSNGIFRDLDVSINVSNDFVTFTSPTDICYNFIESRPLSNALTGYYPSPIVFRATAASGSALTFTATGLPSGISLLSSSSTSATLVGSTTDVNGLSNLRVKALATTDASGTRDVSYAVLSDTITFNPVPASNLSFIQNRAISQFQFTAVALSERPVVSFTSSNLPAGISLATIGVVSGTPTGTTDSSFNVLASTGFTSKTQSFPYTLLPDRALFVANPPVSTYDPGDNVSIDLTAVTYSGRAVSNYAFSNFTQSYGLSINSSNGLITGTLSDSVPPNPLLPTLCNFSVNAMAGTLDVSLGCTLGTGNPIVNRAFLIDTSSGAGVSRLYTDDTSGFSSWAPSGLTGQQWITDLQIKNTTVDSNTFLMCDSGNVGTPGVLRSRDGVNFTAITFVSPTDHPYKAINLSNTSTWYIGGVRGVDEVAFYTSVDDGLTWTRGDNSTSGLSIVPRQNTDITNYYTYQGVALGYSSNVFMIGGQTMMRSADTGSSWSNVAGGFGAEVGNFSMNGPVWVATGSDRYTSGSNYAGSFALSSPTLRWSDDQGATWSNATGSVCDFIGYEVAYASNTWLSTGMDRNGTDSNIVSKLLCSTDGKDWSNVTLSGITFTAFGENHLPEVGSLWFDGSNWNVLVKLDSGGYDCKIYTHGLTPPFTSGWTQRVSTVAPFNGESNRQPRGFWQQYVRTGTPTRATFTFAGLPAGGPTITSPTTTSFTFYQYVTITPIEVTVTGSGFIYYFVDNATLPVGIVFDPLTGKITGQSVELGQKTFTIYMKDNIGVTALTITTNTVIPRVIRQQTSAGAWTSMVRQYTTVNAAQNSVNGHVLPATEATLGEFTRPEPPDSVSASNCPKC